MYLHEPGPNIIARYWVKFLFVCHESGYNGHYIRQKYFIEYSF